MTASPRMLVVDDEPVVCESCTRIFSSQGFAVETANDSHEGLRRAEKEAFDVILLDIKMPRLDGIEFLEALRRNSVQTPVIMITGYSSVPTAAAAMRLGASDYVSKPFTPDEIAEAVMRVISQTALEHAPRGPAEARGAAATDAPPRAVSVREVPVEPPGDLQPWQAAEETVLFLERAWMRVGADGSVRAGALIPPSMAQSFCRVRLPRLGERVLTGLPLAVFHRVQGEPVVIPSPVSGELLEINHALAEDPRRIAADPGASGWLARVWPSAPPADVMPLAPRRVVLLGKDSPPFAALTGRVRALGCDAVSSVDPDQAAAAIARLAAPVALLDADAFGAAGPDIVHALRQQAPGLAVIVLASPDSPHEAQHRAQRILYYALHPLADEELAEVLDSAFAPRTEEPREASPTPHLPSEVNRIRIRNRRGANVSLVAQSDVLLHHSGVGRHLIQQLLREGHPIQTSVGAEKNLLKKVVDEVTACDRLVLLLSEDIGRIPGTMIVNPETDLVRALQAGREKVTTLVIQPRADDTRSLTFGPRVDLALGRHIARVMTAGD